MLRGAQIGGDGRGEKEKEKEKRGESNIKCVLLFGCIDH